MATGAALALAGCSGIAGDPVTTSIPHDVPYEMRASAVAVCYSAHVSTLDEVAAAAAALCREPDTPVTLWRDDLVFNDCPLFKKRRAVFTCMSLKK